MKLILLALLFSVISGGFAIRFSPVKSWNHTFEDVSDESEETRFGLSRLGKSDDEWQKEINDEINNIRKEYNKSWIFYPDGYDHPQLAILEPTPPSQKRSREFIMENIEFQYYSRNNSLPITFRFYPRNLKEEERQLYRLVNRFNKNSAKKVIIHGWKSSSLNNMTVEMRRAYQKKNIDVITVNWQNLCNSKFFFESVNNTFYVGQYLANFVDLLVNTTHIDVSKFHMIGHNLGTHVAGYASNFLSSGKIARITGLDPARPAYETHLSPYESLSYADADFVDVIHTSGGSHGYKYAVGHVDFFPNGGVANQPGCVGMHEKFHCCSHARAYRYFTESISSSMGFYGYKCDSFENFKNGKCTTNPLIMGDKTPAGSTGLYFVETKAVSPFALGRLVL